MIKRIRQKKDLATIYIGPETAITCGQAFIFETKNKKPMIKHEAKFHTKLMKWLKYNLDKFYFSSFLIETKVVRPGQKNFLYSELSKKELRLLKQAKEKFILVTNSDYDRLGTVCDGYCLCGGGYVFLHWVEKGNKKFFVLDIDDILNEINKGSKSLTKQKAAELAAIVGELR
jgi:hypothetical protein